MKKKNLTITLIWLLITGTFGFVQGQTPYSPSDSCIVDVPAIVTVDAHSKLNKEAHIVIKANCQIENFKFTLFNRWGEIVCKSEGLHATCDNSKLIPSTYFWIINGKIAGKDEEIKRNGTLTVID